MSTVLMYCTGHPSSKKWGASRMNDCKSRIKKIYQGSRRSICTILQMDCPQWLEHDFASTLPKLHMLSCLEPHLNLPPLALMNSCISKYINIGEKTLYSMQAVASSHLLPMLASFLHSDCVETWWSALLHRDSFLRTLIMKLRQCAIQATDKNVCSAGDWQIYGWEWLAENDELR